MNRPFSLPIALPRGPEHYWKIMQELNKDGFTIRDVAGCTNGVSFKTVKTYARNLLAQGIIVKIGERQATYGATAHVYKIAKPQRKAPIERRDDFTGARGLTQQQVWTAMRTLAAFSLVELAASASTEEHPVKLRTAENYVRRLVAAGVVEVVKPHRKGAPGAPGAVAGVYRLRPAANSGPLSPKVFNASIVFDPNKNRVLGEAVTEEARS